MLGQMRLPSILRTLHGCAHLCMIHWPRRRRRHVLRLLLHVLRLLLHVLWLRWRRRLRWRVLRRRSLLQRLLLRRLHVLWWLLRRM